jgi:HSP20 family protein
MALVRTDPFRDVDRLFQQLWGGQNNGRVLTMPMDAYRKDDSVLIRVDLPGVELETVDLTVEENVLTIKAERPVPPAADGVESVVSERPYGTFTRQVFLGTNLDTEHIEAEYEAGVLTVVIPVAAHAKPRRIEVKASPERQQLSA